MRSAPQGCWDFASVLKTGMTSSLGEVVTVSDSLESLAEESPLDELDCPCEVSPLFRSIPDHNRRLVVRGVGCGKELSPRIHETSDTWNKAVGPPTGRQRRKVNCNQGADRRNYNADCNCGNNNGFVSPHKNWPMMVNTPIATQTQKQTTPHRTEQEPEKGQQGNGTPWPQPPHNIHHHSRAVIEQSASHVAYRDRRNPKN